MQKQRSLFEKQLSVHFPMGRDIETPFNVEERIFIKDLEGLKKKIANCRKDGKSKLNILADYDSTLTRRTLEGEKADNSFKVLENVKLKITIIT